MSSLFTGGEGFIGRNIISKLRDMGGEAYSLDIAGKPDYKISITNRKKLEKSTISLQIHCQQSRYPITAFFS